MNLDSTMNLDSLFKELKIENPKKKKSMENPKKKKSETFGEAAKNRLARTKVNLFRKVYDKKQEKILSGTLVRNHIKASIIEVICTCGNIHEHTGRLEVWSCGKIHGEEKWRLTSLIEGRGMYDFHSDLPVHITVQQEYNICSECLRKRRNETNS